MTPLVLTLLAASAPHFLNADGESAVRLAYDLDLPVEGSREQTTRSFLESHASLFGLQRQDELVLISPGDSDVLVFERRRGSVPVLDAEVKATFDSRGRLMMVHLGTPLPLRQRGSFLVEMNRAEAIAARGLEGVQLLESRRVWRRDDDALAATFVVRLARGPEVLRAIVDAETGRLVFRISERMSAGMGAVYDVSPAKGPVVMRTLGGLAAGATTLNGTRAVGLSCDGAQVGGSCTSKAMPNGSGDFVYTPMPAVSNTDRFAEVQGYYQSDRFSAWVTALSPGFALPKLNVYTNVGGQNQGYYLGGGSIELGQGPQADWAYEGDVIFHELGHGVVEHSAQFGFYGADSQGIYAEGGSLNEGSADCLAYGFTDDPILGDFIGPYLLDAGSLTTPYLRRADETVTCHGYNGNLDGGNPGRFGEIHDDGRIIGSFFWAVHTRSQTVAPDAASKSYVAALRGLNGSASFHDVAIALGQHMSALYGTQAGDLVTCLQCEREIPGCDTRTRRIFSGETHESRLLGDELPAPSMANGDRPSTFQYELAVPANAAVTIDRFAITGGALPRVYARFGQKVSWSNGSPTFDATITAQGQMLPAQSTAGTWYLQGTLTDTGNGTRRYGMRAQVVPPGPGRQPAPNVSCSLGSGIGSCTCTPQCTGRVCGSDGCSGSCGMCAAGMACNGAGQCGCVPQCAGKVCGPDGCGGMCGTCASGSCDGAGQCVGCMPVCAGKQCGPNGCGQSCGQCMGDNEICETSTGQCVDAGMLVTGDDGGTDAGTDEADAGDNPVKGACGCSGAGPGALALLATLLLKRRTRG